jgi:phenylacetate-CoA ligase
MRFKYIVIFEALMSNKQGNRTFDIIMQMQSKIVSRVPTFEQAITGRGLRPDRLLTMRDMQMFMYPNFEKIQWLSPPELRKLQDRLLRKMLGEAFRNTRHWNAAFKERGIKLADIKTASDLVRLPVTDKATMRGKQAFISEKIESLGPKLYHTGGSTGRMFSYYTTHHSRFAINACMLRGWRWGGWEDGDRVATFTGGGLGAGHLLLDCVGMNEQIMDEYVKIINESDIQAYLGIPSGLVTFAKHVEKRGIDMRRKCTLTTSENLMPAHRKYIGEMLGEVYDGYGANDGGSSAFECQEHHGWHISSDKCVFEVLKDGEPVSPGEEGILTVTCLYNYGMPWIRYQSNDLAVLSDERCACGRGLPLMSKLLGRTTDLIQTKNCVINGTEVANHIIGLLLPVVAFQIVQKSTSRLIIRIVKDAGWKEEHEQVITKVLLSYEPDLEIRYEYPDDIAKSPAGKSRYVISELDAP